MVFGLFQVRHRRFQPFSVCIELRLVKLVHQRIKMAANWRCEEYAALLPQMAYLLKEHTGVVRVLIAYANLYKTLRDVAPLLKNVTTAMLEYAGRARTEYRCTTCKFCSETV